MAHEPGVRAHEDGSAAAALALRGGAHPDVVERLWLVVPEGTVAAAGYFAVAARPGGRVFGFATGTSTIVLRLGSAPPVDLDALEAVPWGDVPGWWGCAAWLTDIPTPAGLELLRSACGHAAAVATGT